MIHLKPWAAASLAFIGISFKDLPADLPPLWGFVRSVPTPSHGKFSRFFLVVCELRY